MHTLSDYPQARQGASDPVIAAAMPRADILLVEDDAGIGHDTAAELRQNGLNVIWCESAEAASSALTKHEFALCVVDRNLPGMDGLTFIKQLRNTNDHIAVIIISALGEVDDKIHGLQAGGDDYITKPFALVELTARVQAQLRRPAASRETSLRYGPLEMDLIERTVRHGDHVMELLPREFALLAYFMRRPEQLVTRDMLLTDVWHYNFLPQTNLVDVHLGKLRRKIDVHEGPSLIQSVRGVGFVLRAE
jgi:two-component system OmpR family response regulator